MRLIDADALKEVIFSKTNGMEDLWDTAGVLNAINKAPTVTPDKIQAIMSDYLIYRCEPERPQGEWIPVRKKLPDVVRRYLVYTIYNEMMTDFFTGDKFMQGDDILAWMPLPEPYIRGGEEE